MGLRQISKLIEEARQKVAVGVLATALAAVGGSAACGNTTGASGTPPDSGTATDAGMNQGADAAPTGDAGPVDAATGTVDIKTDSGPVTYYGPQPVDAGPTDTATDTVDIKADSGPVTYYGPQPIDAGPTDIAKTDADTSDTGSTDIGPADAKDTTCAPVAIYGPKPCVDDAECDTAQHPGWYCDKDNAYDNGCGGTIVWPTCKAP